MPAPECCGDFQTNSACTLSRVRPGCPMQIRGKCDRCAERRCRTHCRCGRNGWATGQAAGRPSPLGIAQAKPQAKAQAKAKAHAVAAPAPAVPPVILPVGRPSMLSVDLLETTEWFQELMTEIRGARHVIIGSTVPESAGVRQLADSQRNRLRLGRQLLV